MESGSNAVSKLLVDAGALNSPNILGHTPAMLAACHGHYGLLEYFDTHFYLSNIEKYNCYCLHGAREMLTNTTSALEWWLRAISVCTANPHYIIIDFKPLAVYGNLREPCTSEELYQLNEDAG